MNILITGATGFIGSSLLHHLNKTSAFDPIAAVRKSTEQSESIKSICIGDLQPDTNWKQGLSNIDTIIHLAARVHVMCDTVTDPLTEFRRINVAATINLARQAAFAGVRRFIYISSIKVNGEYTQPTLPFTADDKLSHLFTNGNETVSDPYGLSKFEAEQGLHLIAQQTGMEVVIIRPPMVYGVGVKGNFQSMMYWLHKGIPLPLSSIHNQRSLVALPNLIDFITVCIDHPAAANQTFLVSDGEDLSTTELLQRLGLALGGYARLLPVPQKLLEISLNLLGKRAITQRLCGNLQVDISKNRNLLGWIPPVSVDDALKETARAYLKRVSEAS